MSVMKLWTMDKDAFIQASVSEVEESGHEYDVEGGGNGIVIHPREDDEYHLSEHVLGLDMVGSVEIPEVDVVAGPDDVDEGIDPNENAGRSNGIQEKAEDGKFDGLISDGSAIAGRIDEVEEGGGRIKALDFSADNVEGEELERAVEGKLDHLGGPGIKSRDEGWRQAAMRDGDKRR